jgi:hypothetical protein
MKFPKTIYVKTNREREDGVQYYVADDTLGNLADGDDKEVEVAVYQLKEVGTLRVLKEFSVKPGRRRQP